jgi:hypothetical protein
MQVPPTDANVAFHHGDGLEFAVVMYLLFA